MKALLPLFLLTACLHPTPTPVPATNAPWDMAGAADEYYGVANCPRAMTVSYSDVCDGFFTTSGLSCAHCTGAAACYDTVDIIYCARGEDGCLSDPACVHVKDGSSKEMESP